MLTYLLFVIIFLCFLHILFNYNYKARLVRKIPGPDGAFIYGNALANFNMSSVEMFHFFRGLVKKYCTISSLWAFPYGLINIYEPEDIKILISNTKHNKKNMYYNFLESWLQDGLLISHGEKWQRRRKNLLPAFNMAILKRFCKVFEGNSQRLIGVLNASKGMPIDLTSILSEFTLHTICETAMGIKLRDENAKTVKTYTDALVGIGRVFAERSRKVYYYPECLYRLTFLKTQETKYADKVHAFTKKVIDEKTKSNDEIGLLIDNNNFSEENLEAFYNRKSNVAFLDLLLLLQKDGLIDESGVHEEVNTFMFEGHDTTSAALLYTLMLLANNKHIQDNITEELNDIFGESDRGPTMEDLSAMRYLERCIKESLRLYPPVAMIGRLLSEETTLSGYKVPAGVQCAIHIYDLHRREDLFKDPFVFDPDRFLPENSAGRHPFAYIPFSAGPRNCIGLRFAMLEMKSILSAIMRKFKLEPITTPADLEFRFDLILKCVVPVKVAFMPRK